MDNKDYQQVFTAIEKGLVFSDEKDEDDFLVLVDENRELDSFKPKKDLIKEMEEKGLIEAIEKETKREYITFRGSKRPLSLISIYKITAKDQFLLP